VRIDPKGGPLYFLQTQRTVYKK